MKKFFTAVALFAASACSYAQQQYQMKVVKLDGTTILYKVGELDYVEFIQQEEEDDELVIKEKSIFLAGDNVMVDGPLEIKSEKTGPWKDGTLWYPTQLTNDPDKLHGVVIFCAGGGETSTSQPAIPKRLASMGFVVYSMSSDGSGSNSSEVFDWLDKRNNTPGDMFYGKLKTDRVGITGHSMGGIRAEECTRADKRVCTLMMCNSGDFSHAGATTITVPVGFITGHTDMAYDNSLGDYNNAGNKAPMWLGVQGQEGHGYGPWGGAFCVAAWMRWHVAGEQKWEKEFLQQGGMFNNSNGWETYTKNW